jgi:glycerophosphoryl diester phosphodiesterase
MEQPVVDAILKYDLLNRAIISSFNPLRLLKIKYLHSNITTAQLWDEDEKFSSICWIYLSRPDLLHGNIDQFNENKILWLRALGLKIYAYTVNSDKQLAKVKRLNLHGIFTDDPTNCK